MSRTAIAHRLRADRLHARYPGTYSLSAHVTAEQGALAAVIAVTRPGRTLPDVAVTGSSGAAHGHRAAFGRDRTLDSRRQAHGIATVRVSRRRLAAAPEALVADLAGALARRGRPV